MTPVSEPDLLIIGGGAAGLSAAATADGLGLTVELLDERSALGGNLYAGVGKRADDDRAFGPDQVRGRALLAGAAGATRSSSTFAWRIERDGRTFVADGAGGVRSIAPRRLLIATGAMERPVPIPGAMLPGVMYAGAAQLLLKSAASVPAGRCVLVGSGPLLLLVATQLLAFGVRPAGIVETKPRTSLQAFLSHLPSALNAPGLLARGIRLLGKLKASGVPFHRGAIRASIAGRDRVERVEFTDAEGRRQSIEAELVLLHDGIIPNDHVTRQLGCRERWNEAQHCFQPETDPWGETSLPGVFAAGDCTGIGGGRAAELAGTLAALEIARQLGRIAEGERDRQAERPRRALRRQHSFRPFLEMQFPPSIALAGDAASDTVLCRCEDVTAGEIRLAVAQGATGPDQLKSFTRCGMGPCQGRSCSMAVAEIIAKETGSTVEAIGRHEIRSPLKPLPLGQIATAEAEVVR